ncbi:hypothetical protein BCR36DRAFT_411036 [Piromyces finnis]|uniref:SH3 domain-containing protein n=1 Tax=Piromyces finnis TaxID=1754191 RepID=A0A1Y1VG09_9FUNG|nr:hypothetical protein BCR36DRAFT_411036 [Piromyces finnis]|eukprot:ORX53891.1 hypothetical protein BCR36DRAFT_411036 [Piromyces finnis]
MEIQLLIFILVTLIIFVIISYVIASYGRKYSLPEEVTKGIKSDTPFPSPISSNHNKHHHHHHSHNNSRQNISKNSSTLDLINNEPYLHPDFEINDSTFIVRKEFVPKSVDELPIKKNQILSIKEIYEDGWCMAISMETGEMGVVPFQCLYKYSDFLKKKSFYQKQMQMQQLHQSKISTSSQSSQYCQPYTTPPLIFNK